MYSLYESYGQPPGMLFSIGFTSSAVFGTFLGILVDKSPSPNPPTQCISKRHSRE